MSSNNSLKKILDAVLEMAVRKKNNNKSLPTSIYLRLLLRAVVIQQNSGR